jgi:5-(carboxyamino)imidazole ribonucleotide synthase
MSVTRIGVVGGGQLGQMMALAGIPLGLQVSCLERTADCPAALVCPVVVGDPSSAADVAAFAFSVDVVTYETESIAAEPLRGLHVLPGLTSLEAAQDRWAEKQLFAAAGVPCAPTVPASSEAELHAALVDLPRLVKTRTGGYDGRGQVMVLGSEDVSAALALLDEPGPGVVIEGLVPFDREVSIIGARTSTGSISCWPLSENHHERGILRASKPIDEPELQSRAVGLLTSLLTALDHVGVLTLELFVVGDELIANEIAPRVHNSGHWTIEGSTTSQFEQHLRAIAGLPLGRADVVGHVVMRNLIGDMPDASAVLGIAGAHLHTYGKSARRSRKLGHVTVAAAEEMAMVESLGAVNRLIRDDG